MLSPSFPRRRTASPRQPQTSTGGLGRDRAKGARRRGVTAISEVLLDTTGDLSDSELVSIREKTGRFHSVLIGKSQVIKMLDEIERQRAEVVRLRTQLSVWDKFRQGLEMFPLEEFWG